MRLSDRALLSSEDVFVNKQQATDLILAVKNSVQVSQHFALKDNNISQ